MAEEMIQISLSPGGKILVAGNTWAVKDVLKAMPGARWDRDACCWTFPASPVTARDLFRTLPTAQLAVGMEKLIIEADRQDAAQNHKTADDLEPIPLTVTEPWKHQLRAFWYCVDMWRDDICR